MSRSGSRKFDHFYRFNEIRYFLKKQVKRHPKLITLESVGKSFENRDLWLVKISNSGFDGSKPVIFIEAGTHAREWIPVMTTISLINELTENANQYPEMFDVDWMILPVLNPDGYEYSHTKDRMWRKSRSVNNGSTCRGTDTNRNFAYKWEVPSVASDDPCISTFRGPHPESDPEVKVLSNLLLQNRDIIKLYLSMHAFGGSILYGPGYKTGIHYENEEELEELGFRVAAAIMNVNPNEAYQVANSAEYLYPAAGASDDFAMGAAGIPYAYTIEIGTEDSFEVPPSKISQLSREIFAGYREFAIAIGEMFSY